MAHEVVVKVGGSLFDLPDLGRRLRAWLDAQTTMSVLIVPGGGQAADLVRAADKLDQLGEEQGHWLALRALSLTAHILAARLPRSMVICDIHERETAWRDRKTPILDMHSFATADEARADHLPHLWDATSDSLAARVAWVAKIPNLVLLKSCPGPQAGDWRDAARDGLVDRMFPVVTENAGPQLNVTWINFRN